MGQPRFSSALSVAADSSEAEREAIAQLEDGLQGETPDLVVAFATHHHGPALEELGPRLRRRLGAPAVIGCTAESVIGPDKEIERSSGLALWGACLPGTRVRFFDVQATAGPEGEPVFSRLPAAGEIERACVLILADPFTFPADAFLVRMNEDLAGLPVMGGMASGGMGPGQSLLFTAEGVRDSGAVGVVLEGGLELCPIVSQGCRPVGRPWVITACERNLIQKLGGKPALEVLIETWNELPEADRKLLQSAPFVGLAIDPTRSSFDRGDFLVRGIMGLHQRDRAIAVADFVRRGQTVQLLVRDARSADEDLRQLLSAQAAPRGPHGTDEAGAVAPAAGALIFSCNGRGSRMFARPDHDVSCVRKVLAPGAPVAGFFAAGEIGPVGGRNFLHGFTASVAVFRCSPA